jgi:hypothetical protein
MSFSVEVQKGAVGIAKGTYQVQIHDSGVTLSRSGQEPIAVPVGSSVQVDAKATLQVATDNHEFRMRVLGFTLANQRLAEDLGAFLNKQAPPPNVSEYKIPTYLFVLAVLPFGIMIVTRGGALWGAVGGGLFAVGVAVAKRQELPLAARIAILVLINVLAYGGVIALVLALSAIAGVPAR